MSQPPSRLSREDFLAAFGPIYEHSPWVAEAVWPGVRIGALDGVEAMATAMAQVVDQASDAQKMALVRAHPELAGRTSIDLAPDSRAEQTGAGLDRCTPDEFAAFQHLNEAYNATFGFPFIVAVKGMDRKAILEAFADRLSNDPDTEFAEAIRQIHRIARFRLEQLMSPS